MQETVQYQMKVFKGEFSLGDVILSNHPSAGGSHLPDLTIITPVFYKSVYHLHISKKVLSEKYYIYERRTHFKYDVLMNII